jgi:hypothetical protein
MERMNGSGQESNDDQPDWPFPHIPPELYWSLPEADRAGLEQIIKDLVDGTNSKH